MDYTGKTALVTAGADGLGLACAHHLAALGAGIVFCDPDQEAAESAEAELEMHGVPVYGMTADIARARDVEALLGEAVRVFGRLDLVVVVGSPPAPGGLTGLSDADFDRAIAAGVRGPFLVCQRAARLMSGGGTMVLVGGGTAAESLAGAAIGGALRAMAGAMAAELGEQQIRVHAVEAGSAAAGAVAGLVGYLGSAGAAGVSGSTITLG